MLAKVGTTTVSLELGTGASFIYKNVTSVEFLPGLYSADAGRNCACAIQPVFRSVFRFCGLLFSEFSPSQKGYPYAS